MATSLQTQDGDLIDLNVGSPVLQGVFSEGVTESPSDSLLDSELPVLEKKLKVASEIVPQASTFSYVDLEDILIAIDEDDDVGESSATPTLSASNSKLLFEIKESDAEDLENLEVFDILTKLDELLNDTLEKSGIGCDESFDGLNELELESKSIEDCLEDLDNYLKEIDASSSGSQDTSTESDTPGSFEESQTSTVLSSSSPLTDEAAELSPECGHVNLAYEDTEDLLPLFRSNPLRATIAGINRPALQRNTVRRRSLESPSYCASVHISGTAGDLPTEVHSNNVHECRSYPPGDCSTGTVVVEFTRNSDNHESSWLRTSMRRIRHLRLPSNETHGATETTVSEVSEMVPARVEVSQSHTSATEATTTVRPFSAPSRLTNAATQSSVRTTRDSRRNTVRAAGARNLGTSRSRRQRSLSSSESSLTSSVYTTPSCTPAPTPTRSNQEVTVTANVRR
ncbi:uncharacterized protein LOC116164359 [Photinus pyralis]|nr:uncharacterized protein LOC116164359 [Photinus pyralis]XP_031334385.1 uncharacterized protein LOC116164359 [Photinus pyralis]XP_031334386.1 uncharacterized protein LOC116164359 [Photinus pyralis]